MRAFGQAIAPVRALVALLLVEALAVFVIALILVAELISGNYQNLYAEIFLIALALGATLWVFTLANEILNKKRWARSGAFFWQLLQAVVGAGAVAEENSNRAIGAALIIVAGICLLLLFNQKVVEATNEQAEN